MGALIDTCVLIDLERAADSAPWRRLPDDELFISAVSVMELRLGIAYSSGAKRVYREAFLNDVVLQRFDCISLDAEIANRCGQLSHDLESSGRRIGHSDTWIAATALTRAHAVVTHNLEHFNRVQSLRIVPWVR